MAEYALIVIDEDGDDVGAHIVLADYLGAIKILVNC